jgi:hypothetical protein
MPPLALGSVVMVPVPIEEPEPLAPMLSLDMAPEEVPAAPAAAAPAPSVPVSLPIGVLEDAALGVVAPLTLAPLAAVEPIWASDAPAQTVMAKLASRVRNRVDAVMSGAP